MPKNNEEEIEKMVEERVKAALERQKEKPRVSLPKLPFFSHKDEKPQPQELFPYLLAPSLVEIKPDRARFNEMMHRIIEASGYPRHVDDAWLYAFLSKNENYDISIHVEPLGISDTLTFLHNQIVRQSSDLYQSQITGTPNQALETKLGDTKRLYESLYKGEEKIFRISLYVDNKENTEEKLNFLTEKCKSNLNSMLIIPKTCNYRMAEGIKSCLPLCQDMLKVQQEFSTNSLAATIPFISTSSGRKDGVLFAKEEETKTPVFIDFDSLANKHFFVLGTSGAGKSFTAKYLLIQLYLALDANIYVLDPNAEYKELCNRFGGQNIEISRTSDNVINVFDLANEDYGSKMLSLISIFDLIVGGLSESQKGVLNRLLIQTYELRGITQKDASTWNNEPPTFSDFYNIVQKARKDALNADKLQNKAETKSLEVLANRTSMYAKGGFFGFLDQRTKIDIKQRFINFDLSALPGAVKPLMMFAVLDFIVREIKKDNKPKILLIDEGWTLLRSKEAENYLLEFIKTSRKYGASIGFITQELEDLLSSDSGKSILNQTSTKILMRQNTTNIDLISNFLKLNDSEKDFLIKCQKGHGLLIAGDDHTRFFTKPPKGIHEMITTDPNEVLELKRRAEQGQSEAVPRSTEEKPLSPEEGIRWGEKKSAGLDINKDYYKASELDDNQVKVLKSMGYKEVAIEPFGGGHGPTWLVLPRGRESPKHALLVRAARDEILRYCNDVILNDSVEPDIVAVHKGKKIAFEIETGSWIETRTKELEARFTRLKDRYPDGYYIVVTHSAYEAGYQQYGVVITKPRLKESIKAIFA